MAAPGAALDWAALQADVVAGRELSNDRMAALLPCLAQGQPAQALQTLQASGALYLMGPADRVQYPYMASLVRQAYLRSGRQQRGLLVCAQAARMGGSAQLLGGKKERQAKRPLESECGVGEAGQEVQMVPVGPPAGAGGAAAAAAAGVPAPGGGDPSAGRFYPSPGPGNDTTFFPARPAPPTMAVRKCTYLDLDVAQRQRYEDLKAERRRTSSGAGSGEQKRRQELKEASEQLPGTFKWHFGEFVRMLPLPSEQQAQTPVLATQKDRTLLWLAFSSPLEMTAGRAIVEVCSLHDSVNGYRKVDRVGGPPQGTRLGISGVGTAPDQPQAPPGAVIRVTHGLEEGMVVFYCRLAAEVEAAPAAAAAGAAAAAAAAAGQQQLQQPVWNQPVNQDALQQALILVLSQLQQQPAAGAAAMPPSPAALPLPGELAGLLAPEVGVGPAGIPGQMAAPGWGAGGGVAGLTAGTAPGTSGARGPTSQAAAPAAAGSEAAELLSDAGSDHQYRKLVLGTAQPKEIDNPELAARIPKDPALALDVRNQSLFHQQVTMLGDLCIQQGRVLELSDQRFKTEVRALEGSLALISRLNAVEFSWVGDASGARVAGFLAQQLREVLPQAVEVAEDDTHYVAISRLVPHVVAALQQLHKGMQVQTEEMEELQERLQQLEELLPALLAGGFHSLVDHLAVRTAGAKSLPAGKTMGPATPRGKGGVSLSSVTGLPTGVQYHVSPEARKLFAGKSAASIASFLVESLQDPNPSIHKKYQSWATKFGPGVMGQLYLEATTKPTSQDTQGRQRAAAAEFIQLAKGREREMQQGERMEEAAAAAAAGGEKQLRGYQQDMLALAAQGLNLIFVAPTGAGKTEIAVRHSAALLERNPEAKVIFLAPTINLADQQAAEYRTSPPFNSFKYHVECRCGGKSVTSQEWPSLLSRSAVVVLTPEIFRRLLASGAATFDQIDLLILDECHHCRGGTSGSLVLDYYQSWLAGKPAATRPTQVIGFTATPANERTVGGTQDALDTLHRKLLAQYVVVEHDHPELAQHVAQAKDERTMLKPRQADRVFAERLGRVLLQALQMLGEQLQGLSALGVLPTELSLKHEAVESLAMGMFSGAVEQWCASAVKFVEGAEEAEGDFKRDLSRAILVVGGCLSGLSITSNMGCEAAARHLAQLVADTVQQLLGICSEALLGVFGGMSSSSSSSSISGTGADSNSWTVAGLPDVTMALLRMLSREVLGLATLEEAYREGVAGTPKSPKYVEMKRIVMAYKDQHGAHGICFVRTRADSRVLHSIIEADSELGFLQVHLLMGHGAGEGMNVVQQRTAREAFAAEGRHLLVATAAAEEGLNIPSCQFVIRFNATQTGRERMQSRGRTRMPGSVYYELVEEGGLEERLAHKSVLEETNMKLAMKLLKAWRI